MKKDAADSAFGVALFRRIWTGSLFANFGAAIIGAGASWKMTQIATTADMVAAVQTMVMLPVLLFALPAGAMADAWDRRKVALVSLLMAAASALALAVLAGTQSLTPYALLACCFLLGTSMALYAPSWQASARDQVPPARLHSAVMLNSISYNVARGIGPAVGGAVITLGGTISAFSLGIFLYLPLISTLFRWRMSSPPTGDGPGVIAETFLSRVVEALGTPGVRPLLFRTFLSAVAAGGLSALLPLVAQRMLLGGAGMYGFLLAMLGAGSLAAAWSIPMIRARCSAEVLVRLGAMLTGGGFVLLSVAGSVALAGIVLVFVSAGWVVMVTMLNIGVQVVAPSVRAGRVIAAFQASLAGGVAAGSWLWGHVAQAGGLEVALGWSGAATMLASLIGLWFRVPDEKRGISWIAPDHRHEGND